MPPSGPAARLLRRQKRAAERLRREVFDLDGSLRHPYFRELRALRDYRCTLGSGDLVAACAGADLVYVGDYHAVPACQRFAAELLRGIASRVPRLALGVEFVYTRQQRILDRRQAGALDDRDFLRRIHYREEWGYPWDGFRALLDAARECEVPVHALDSPPRGGYDGTARRDAHAARRIVRILEDDPARRLMVLFGESHVTRSHLPRKVETRLKRAGLERSGVTVFQNPDRIYWLLVERGERPDTPVRIDAATYAVSHTGPLEKYEAYRQVLDRWQDDVPADEEVDLTPAVHHLIRVLLGWLGVRPGRRRVRHRAGWVDDLSDTFPEVYGGVEARELLGPILEEHGRTTEEIREARQTLARQSALYDSRANVLFLQRYLPGRAAGEAARYLRAALTGRLFIAAPDFRADPAVRAYGAAYTAALVQLGSRLIDPVPDAVPDETTAAGAAAGVAPAGMPGAAHPAEDDWLEAHRRFERSRRVQPGPELLEPLRDSRPLRRALARDLGGRLGRVLFERVREGSLDQRQLRSLFTRPLDPVKAPRNIIRLLRGPTVGQKRTAPGGAVHEG